MAGQFAVNGRAHQRAVGNDHLSGAETLPPFFIGEIAVNVDVHAIVSDRDSGPRPTRSPPGRDAQAALEELEIDELRPQRIAVGVGIVDLVARFAAGFVGDDRIAADIAVGHLDGIDLSQGNQQGQVPVKGARDIDPKVGFALTLALSEGEGTFEVFPKGEETWMFPEGEGTDSWHLELFDQRRIFSLVAGRF